MAKAPAPKSKPEPAQPTEPQIIIQHNLLDSCGELLMATGAQAISITAVFPNGFRTTVETVRPVEVAEPEIPE